jgi:hypothetical protein
MSCQVKTSGQWHLQDKKHQYFSFVSLPTDSVIVDHAVPTELPHTFSYIVAIFTHNHLK